MNKSNKLPVRMPDYAITESKKASFPVKWEELMGWFIVPRLGERMAWAMYDSSEKIRSEIYELEVIGRASVHGICGVEITAREYGGGKHEFIYKNRNTTRTFIAQLTDTHCRFLAQSHYEGDIRHLYTFLDGDEFLKNWGFGEDNCGNEINLKPKGIINRKGENIEVKAEVGSQIQIMDVVGRYDVNIGVKIYDCICVIDIETYESGILSEQFIDSNGRTILWRRFNRNDWKLKSYKQLWSEKLPENERLTVDGNLYVHWYDCITDYIL